MSKDNMENTRKEKVIEKFFEVMTSNSRIDRVDLISDIREYKKIDYKEHIYNVISTQYKDSDAIIIRSMLIFFNTSRSDLYIELYSNLCKKNSK